MNGAISPPPHPRVPSWRVQGILYILLNHQLWEYCENSTLTTPQCGQFTI